MTTISTPTPVVLQLDVTSWSNVQRMALLQQISTIEGTAPESASGDANRTAGSNESTVDDESTGWTVDAYVEAIAALLRRHGVQAQVINDAIATGTGYVSREEVYVIGSYAPNRSLKGFTRPVNRVTQQLVDEGKLPEDAADLLVADYDPDVKGYQRAKGFQVPMEVVRLMKEERDRRQMS